MIRIGLPLIGQAAAAALWIGAMAGPPAMAAGETASPRASAKAAHRVVYQISSNDPAAMQHALSSADNALKLYRERGESATIEIVANGGGVHMMRADTSPVMPMMAYMRGAYPDLVLTACGTTKAIMEAKEGRPLAFLDGVRVLPAGIVRVIELQEQGYAYVKP